MNILMIGGSGFIGRHVVSNLQKSGHTVTLFHRGSTLAPTGTDEIIGDRNRLGEHLDLFKKKKFDLVIDMILSSERQARELMDTFRGLTARVVASSSMDVYRAWGVFYGFEPGSLQEMPVTENSELRTSHIPYPPEVLKKVQQIYPWVDDEYEKINVEKAVLNDRDLPGTVLRLPMVYGPGDPVHRFHFLLKRIDDGRQTILFAEDVAALRTPRGYVENVAHAITLAASSDRIRKELGYRELISLDESIHRTIDWEREHPPVNPMAQFDYPAEDAAIP